MSVLNTCCIEDGDLSYQCNYNLGRRFPFCMLLLLSKVHIAPVLLAL